MNWMSFHLLYQFVPDVIYIMFIYIVEQLNSDFLIGKIIQIIVPFFHVIFSLCVQTFLLKIQQTKDMVVNAIFFRE